MSSVGIHPPKTPATKGCLGTAKATLPNVCKMPGPPAPFVPSPLPNIAKSEMSPKGYSKKVKIESNTVAIRGASFKSMGDMASKGTGGGLISANTHGPAKFITPGSLTVKIEGKSVHLLGEPMLNNCGPSGSPPNTGATMTGFKRSSSKKGKEDCPHPSCYKKKVDRDEKIKKTEDEIKKAKDDVKEAEDNLKAAENAKAIPYKLRSTDTKSATLTQNVKKAKNDVGATEAYQKSQEERLKGLKNEKKVEDDEGGENIEVRCAECDELICEIDVLTDDGRAKEVKSSGEGYRKTQFDEQNDALNDPRAIKAIGKKVIVEVAVVNIDSESICEQLEQNNGELKGRTQDHKP